MNWKKALLFGLLFWVFIFVLVSVIMFMPGISQWWQKVLNLIVDVILVLVLGKIYFAKYPADFKNGLLVGLVWLVVGAILDALVTVPLFVKDWNFFWSKSMLVAYVITMLGAGLAAQLFSRKDKASANPSEPPATPAV